MIVEINRYKKSEGDWCLCDTHKEYWSVQQYENFIKDTKNWSSSVKSRSGMHHEVIRNADNSVQQVIFSSCDFLKTEWLFERG